jgi:hypothetical protein
MSTAHQRWAGFLDQIAERHAAIGVEVEAAAREALRASNYDPGAINASWNAATHRLRELERRIIDTWNEKVEATFEAEGVDHETRMSERRKGADLAYTLENAQQALEMRILADGAREMYARALSSERAHVCARCGASMPMAFTYRALDVACPACGTPGVFEPSADARNVVAFGAHALAWETAQRDWLAMRVAERAVRDARPPAPLAALKRFERAQIAYWTRYIGAKAHLVPEVGDVALEVRSRMDPWYRMKAEYEEEWVRAGRPRETI